MEKYITRPEVKAHEEGDMMRRGYETKEREHGLVYSNIMEKYKSKLVAGALALSLLATAGCTTTQVKYQTEPKQAYKISVEQYNQYPNKGYINKEIEKEYKEVVSNPAYGDKLLKAGEAWENVAPKDVNYVLFDFKYDNADNSTGNNYVAKSKDKKVLVLSPEEIYVPYGNPFSSEYDKIKEEIEGYEQYNLFGNVEEWVDRNKISFRDKTLTEYWDLNNGLSLLAYHSKDKSLGVYKVNIYKEGVAGTDKVLGVAYLFIPQDSKKAKLVYKEETNLPLINGLYAIISNLAAVALTNPPASAVLNRLGTLEGGLEGVYTYVHPDSKKPKFLYLINQSSDAISFNPYAGLLGDMWNHISKVNVSPELYLDIIKDKEGNVYGVVYPARDKWNVKSMDKGIEVEKLKKEEDKKLLEFAWRTILETMGLEAVKKLSEGTKSHYHNNTNNNNTNSGGNGNSGNSGSWFGNGSGSHTGGPVISP